MEIRNFDFFLTRNKAGNHVAIVDDEEFTPYMVVDGKRYAVDDLLALIPANDAALNWADANARWFDISTAPKDYPILLWGDHKWGDEVVYAEWVNGDWVQYGIGQRVLNPTHWRPLPPPPSNPPLPAPLEALGAVLRRLKGVA